jgi:hypothetical protein
MLRGCGGREEPSLRRRSGRMLEGRWDCERLEEQEHGICIQAWRFVGMAFG